MSDRDVLSQSGSVKAFVEHHKLEWAFPNELEALSCCYSSYFSKSFSATYRWNYIKSYWFFSAIASVHLCWICLCDNMTLTRQLISTWCGVLLISTRWRYWSHGLKMSCTCSWRTSLMSLISVKKSCFTCYSGRGSIVRNFTHVFNVCCC